MRIYLKGEGSAIPDVALPGPGTIGDLPPQTFLLPDGVDFAKEDYVNLGYTNYEVICIGAAGGQGGGVRITLDTSGGKTHSFGGGGGGGGLHRVLGLLADLPALCPVVVGQAGANGIDGNGDFPHSEPWPFGEPEPPANPNYVAPAPGGDGGASSFNGATCRASGGKGGDGTPVYRDMGTDHGIWTTIIPGGNGGEGGLGGSAVAGGGAAGSEGDHSQVSDPEIISAEDGIWDGVIGEGGGGGMGGTYRTALQQAGAQTHAPYTLLATSGGQGSFSYGDSSMYGPRKTRSNDPVTNKVIVPGSGGGAKLNTLSGYGSLATGFSPHGVVFLRLTKIG